MALIIGNSDARVTPIGSSGNNDDFGKWVHVPYFRSKNVAKNEVSTPKQKQSSDGVNSFATLLKLAEQNNGKTQTQETVLLKPANRAGTIDILA